MPELPGDATLRLASEPDLARASALARSPSVEPYLAPTASDPEALRAFWLEQSAAEGPGGLYVLELSGGAAAAVLGLSVVSPRSRICQLSRLMVDPERRRQQIGTTAVRLACELVLITHDYHRIQAESYGDNEAGQRLFESLGFTREGMRRRAYWRRDRWIDGVLYGLLAEEFSPQARS